MTPKKSRVKQGDLVAEKHAKPGDPVNESARVNAYVSRGSGSYRRQQTILYVVEQIREGKDEHKIRVGLIANFTERKVDEYMRAAKDIVKAGL